MKLLRINMEHLTYRYEDIPDNQLLWGGRALTSLIIVNDQIVDEDYILENGDRIDLLVPLVGG